MKLIDQIGRTQGLVSFWTFQEAAGLPRVAVGRAPYALVERGGVVPRANDGFFGPHSAVFGGDGTVTRAPWLEVRRECCPELNFCGPHSAFTMLAWVKRRHVPGTEWSCQAVAGMWNEHGKRQYCLFLNLRINESAEQVGAHISGVGGPTPGFKYCMTAGIGATAVPFDAWHCAAISYDGHVARAYLDGKLDSREAQNPYAYPGGLHDGGDAGADFTVGAVARPERVEMIDGKPVEIGQLQANLFRGLLGGLAVYNRCLTGDEINHLSVTELTGLKPSVY